MAGTGILVVSPIPYQHGMAVPPVLRMLLVEGPHCIRYSPIGAVSRDLGEAGVDQLIYIGGLKGFGDRGAHKPGTPYTVSVVRDAGGRLAIVRGTLRIAGIDEAPGVDEERANTGGRR